VPNRILICAQTPNQQIKGWTRVYPIEGKPEPRPFFSLNKLNHRSTNTGLGSTTSAPRGGDIKDKEREVRAGRNQGSRPSGHARTKEEAMWCTEV